MYCTNCGAQVSPNDSFCMKCGAPVDAGAVNVSGAEEVLKEVPPSQMQEPVRRKKKVWPIIACIVAALAVISVGAGLLIKHILDTVVIRTHFEINDNLDRFDDEPEDPDEFDIDDFDDFDDFDPDDYGFGAFGSDDYGFGAFGPYGFNFDDFFEEFGNPDSSFDYSGGSDTYTEYEYEYAFAYYYDDCVYLEGRDVLKDSTVIYNDRTLGEFCDYIDEKVLEKGKTIDRELLYDLLSVHLADQSIYKDNEEYFEQAMMYCLSFANEFGSMDLEIEDCTYYLDEPSVYYYDVETDDAVDTWIVDYAAGTLYMNEGDSEYKSVGDYSMFSDNTLTVWLTATEEFFGIE